MNARHKLVLVIGLGVIAAAIIWRFSQKNVQQPVLDVTDDSGDNFMNTVSSAVKRIWDTIPSSPYLPLLKSVEQSLGIPDTLLTRMAWIESRFNPNAHNASGATGIMQIIPSIHTGVDAKNPNAAIPYAGNYLKQLYKQFGSWEKAAAAYNWGPGHLQKDIAINGTNWKAGLPAETADYIAQINQVIDLPA